MLKIQDKHLRGRNFLNSTNRWNYEEIKKNKDNVYIRSPPYKSHFGSRFSNFNIFSTEPKFATYWILKHDFLIIIRFKRRYNLNLNPTKSNSIIGFIQ